MSTSQNNSPHDGSGPRSSKWMARVRHPIWLMLACMLLLSGCAVVPFAQAAGGILLTLAALIGIASCGGSEDGAGTTVTLPNGLGTVVLQGTFTVGPNIGSQAGKSLGGGADINGDGFGDVIVGAPNFSPSAVAYGQSFIIMGGANLEATPTIELGALDGTNGFAVNGSNGFCGVGTSVTLAGDLNGDGRGDAIIGAPNTGASGEGQVAVLFGSCTVGSSGSIAFSDISGAVSGMKLQGPMFSNLGQALDAAGDFNNDGIDDLIIGSDNGYSGEGRGFVVFGDSSLPTGSTSINPNIFNAIYTGPPSYTGAPPILSGFTADAIPYSSEYLSDSVGAAGDMNGDGFDDVIFGTTTSSNFIVFGNATLGTYSVSGAGYSSVSITNYNSMTMNGGTLDGTQGFIFMGGYGAKPVGSAGDLNGDGYDDVFIGNPSNYSGAGEVFIVFGQSGPFASSISGASLTGSDGFIIQGACAEYSKSGFSVSSLGDLNNDGFDDIIIGAPKANNGRGRAYVIFGSANIGSTNGAGTPMMLPDVATGPDLSISGTGGATVSFPASGQTIIVTIEGSVDGDNLGHSVSGVGDLNGDGFPDLMIGIPYAADNGLNSGKAVVVLSTVLP